MDLAAVARGLYKSEISRKIVTRFSNCPTVAIISIFWSSRTDLLTSPGFKADDDRTICPADFAEGSACSRNFRIKQQSPVFLQTLGL